MFTKALQKRLQSFKDFFALVEQCNTFLKGENYLGSWKIILKPGLNHLVDYLKVIWRKLLVIAQSFPNPCVAMQWHWPGFRYIPLGFSDAGNFLWVRGHLFPCPGIISRNHYWATRTCASNIAGASLNVGRSDLGKWFGFVMRSDSRLVASTAVLCFTATLWLLALAECTHGMLVQGMTGP